MSLKNIHENKIFSLTYDIHTHTTFSHGKGTIEDNVKAAVERRAKDHRNI